MKRRFLAMLFAAMMTASLSACGAPANTDASAEGGDAPAVKSGVEDGVLTIAMECAYAPYNWVQADDSNGAVPISNNPAGFANGYDIMIANKLCEANGWELEVVQADWGSLVPGVQSGTYDAAIAGQSMTRDRMEQVDFAGPYFYATMVVLTKADGPYAQAASINDFGGAKGTAQEGTIWYTDCLAQMEGAEKITAAENAPAMLMALETGAVDFVCTDRPTAMGATTAYPDLKMLDFSGTDGDFVFDEAVREENVNIGISVKKGNTVLAEAMDAVLSTMTEDDFNAMMDQAIAVQPMNS